MLMAWDAFCAHLSETWKLVESSGKQTAEVIQLWNHEPYQYHVYFENSQIPAILPSQT